MNPWLILGFFSLAMSFPTHAQRPPRLTVVVPPTGTAQPQTPVAQPQVQVAQPPTTNQQPNLSFTQPTTSIPSPAPTPSLAPAATPYNQLNTGAGRTLAYPQRPQVGSTPTQPMNSLYPVTPSGVVPGTPTLPPGTGTATSPSSPTTGTAR